MPDTGRPSRASTARPTTRPRRRARPLPSRGRRSASNGCHIEPIADPKTGVRRPRRRRRRRSRRCDSPVSRVEGPDVDSPIFRDPPTGRSRGSDARPAGRPATETTPTPCCTSWRERDRFASGLRDPVDLGSRIGGKEDRARRRSSVPPRADAASQSVWGAPPDAVDLLQLPLREERDRAAVRRPEGKRCAVRAVERAGVERIERAHEEEVLTERAPATKASRFPSGESASIPCERHVLRRNDREPHRRNGAAPTRDGARRQGSAPARRGHSAPSRREDEPSTTRERPGASGARLRTPVAARRRNRQRLQRERDVARRLEALLGLLLEAVPHDPLERRATRARRAASPGGSSLRIAVIVSAPVSRWNGAPAREHLVEHRAEGEDVGAGVDGCPRTCSGDM